MNGLDDRDGVDEKVDRFLDGANVARMEIDGLDERQIYNQDGAIPFVPGLAGNEVAVNNIQRGQQELAGASMMNNPRAPPGIGAHVADPAAVRRDPAEIARRHARARAALRHPQAGVGGAQVVGAAGGHQGGADQLPVDVPVQQVQVPRDVQAVRQLPVNQNNGQQLGADGHALQGNAAINNQPLAPDAVAANNNERFHPYRGNRAGHKVRAQQLSQNILRVIGDIGQITYGRRRRGRGGRGESRGGNRGGNVGRDHGGNAGVPHARYAGGGQIGNGAARQ